MLSAQVAPDKYFVKFTDKDNSPYSIDNPSEFLTQRALDRRAKYGIEISEQDLPVNPQYLTGVAGTGAHILSPSRWMNGTSFYTTEQTVVDAVYALPYVESVTKMADRPSNKRDKFFDEESFESDISTEKLAAKANSMDYGFAYNQINQLNGILLHDSGFKGEGMVIAVLDAGYDVVKTQPLFDSLWANNQILGSKDFVNPDSNNVYGWHYHGRMVLSCMGANIEGLMVGTAPHASYWLLRSEDGATENVIEEYNWVSAAEFADSVGADVINSSLGYIDFDNPVFDHTYEDMNGETAVATIGADIAASKGIMVVNSAGNSGQDGSFPWIGSPADGFDVFSIGAVDGSGNRAGFSSIGPTYDGRIKPTVMAQGAGSTVADDNNSVLYGNGTSFSSPIMAGMTACLMQAYPNKTPSEIIESLKEAGDNSQNPDSYNGWGIPDFMSAYSALTIIDTPNDRKRDLITPFPSVFTNGLRLKVNYEKRGNLLISIGDKTGKQIFNQNVEVRKNEIINLSNFVNTLGAGVYFIQVEIDGYTEVEKIIKLDE